MYKNGQEIVKMYTNGFLVYQKRESNGDRTPKQKEAENNLSRGNYNGYMSLKTSKKVQNYINNLYDSLAFKEVKELRKYKPNKAKITFITLTLPSKQIHTDNYIKRKLLNRFIVTLQDRGKLDAYIWRAEPQRNGNIHFHILAPNFIPWQELRELWNAILGDHGYIEAYRENMLLFHSGGFRVRRDLLDRWSFEKQKRAYVEGMRCNWSNPNTTDIHETYNIKNVANYITKYMCKHGKQEHRKIEGRIWGCSDNLRATKVTTFSMHIEFKLFQQICEKSDNVRVYSNDFCTSYYFNEPDVNFYPLTAKAIFQHQMWENFDIIFSN